MNREDNRVPNVDVMLEQFAQVEVPREVRGRLDVCIDKFLENPQPEVVLRSRKTEIGARRWFVGLSAVASIAILLAAVSFFTMGSRVAWAQAAGALLAKPWVRFTVEIPDGLSGRKEIGSIETLLSNETMVMACRGGDRPIFMDLSLREVFHYDPRTNCVTVESIRDEQIGNFAMIETLRQLVTNEVRDDLENTGSSIQVLDRIESEVQEDGRRWTEFEFHCRNTALSNGDFRVFVRVDPVSGLPVQMRSAERIFPSDPDTGWTLRIDYPEFGPSDIYAMGVPSDATINDRRPVKTPDGDEIQAFLEEYVEAQRQPLEPFSMTVLRSRVGTDFAEISEAIRGRDDGKDVYLEAVNPRDAIFDLSRKVRLGQITQPEGLDRAEWWKQQIAAMKFTPTQEFQHGYLPNNIGYPEELSRYLGTIANLSEKFALIDNPDIKVTLDRQPRLGPVGTVLLNIRIQTAIGSNDLFFWIAPEKDYLVLRQEVHFGNERAAWNNLTVIIDSVEQSPQGRWYATQARYGRIKTHGDDLSNDPLPIEPRAIEDQDPQEIGPIDTTTYRYLVSFGDK